MQRMNRTVFHNPTELMQNIAQVTSFLRKKITAAGGDPFRETLNLIPTTDDAWFFVDERGEFWRASRGAYLMGMTTYGNYEIEDQVNFAVYVPKVDEHFMASLAVIPLQLLGYYVSVAKGLDVDKPRNLAKSVTVE